FPQRAQTKELAAPPRDLDRKLRKERGLREKVEARNVELKKKLKEVKGEAPKLPDTSVVEEKETSWQPGDAALKLDMTTAAKAAAVTSQVMSKNPSNTPTKTVVASTTSNSGLIQSPTSYPPTSESTRKAGNSLTRASSDATKKTNNFLSQNESGRTVAGSLPSDAQNDSVRPTTQLLSQPPTPAAAFSSGKGPAGAGCAKGSVTPLPGQGAGQGPAPAPNPANVTPTGESNHSQRIMVEGEMTAADASSRILKQFNESEGDPGRTTARDNSPVKLSPQLSQQPPQINESTNVAANVATVPTQHPPRNGKKASFHRPSQSLHDFDPLSSHHHVASNSDTVLPIISLPSSYSLGAVPIHTAPMSSTMPITDISGTFMSPNPFVVPVAFEMASTAALTNESQPLPQENGQTLMTNGFSGFQQQQFMVLSQQQPIMIQQMGPGVQQIPETTGGQWVHSSSLPNQHSVDAYQQSSAPVPKHPVQYQQQSPATSHHQRQGQHMASQVSQPQPQNASNPFDPLS
ncbi:MAG: hypothetical protein ACKO9I_02515, partial [Sphaerospermopsis kisseleviana]